MEVSNNKYSFEDNFQDNIEDFANIDDHVSFAEKMITRYDWNYDVKENLTSQLEYIKNKQNDKLLNLTVVGEFGTGKSTFINSVLRSEDFLVSSPLQGTTVAATVIEYAEKYGVVLENHNGESKEYFYDGESDLKKALVTFTTDPSVAKELRNVRIRIPAGQLEDNFRIIDTPGTNANEKWHEEVTVRTIKELSDLVVVIVDANKPMSESFCTFIKNNLGEMLGQCVFITTRIDMVRKRERESILEYIKSRITDDFGIADPMVLPYSSVSIFDSMNSDEISELAMESFKSESLMLWFMARQKSIAQTKKLISLMDSIYAEIIEKMNDLSAGFSDDLELLIRSRQAPLAPFIETQKSEKTEKFAFLMTDIRRDLVNSLEKAADNSSKKVIDNINGQTNLDNLNAYTSAKIKEDCAERSKEMAQEFEKILPAIHEMHDNLMLEFLVGFERLFAELDILRLDFPERNPRVPEKAVINITNITETTSYVSNELSKENKAFFGGAAAGAAIGTAIAPGVGTIIGGLIGFFGGGGVAAPKLDEVKRNTINKVKYPLSKYFSEVSEEIIKQFDDYSGSIESQIVQELDGYLKAYNDEISAKLEKEEEKISEVKGKIESLTFDMSSINNRKFALDSLSKQLSCLV